MTTTDTLRTMEDPTAGGWAWAPQPEARRLVEELLLAFLEKCPEAARLGEQLLGDTGTLITDWVGVILTPDTPEMRERLEAAGYVPRTTEFVDADIHYAFWHPAASTPDILLTDSDRMSVGLLIDSVADFFAANQLSGVDQIQGEPLARARWARVAPGEGAALWVFERHGYDGYHLKFETAEHRIAAMHHLERFRARVRRGDRDRAFAEIDRAVRVAADELGAAWAASLFVRSERERFTRDHCAATSQAARQASLGLGFANIDHMVYATSAAGLESTLELFGVLGYQRRESFDFGAGDTAIVLEQEVNRDVIVVVTPRGEAPGGAGSWTRLLGESLIGGGPAGIAIRGERSVMGAFCGVTDISPKTVSSIPVPSATLEAVKDGIDAGVATSLASGGLVGPVVTLVSRSDGARGIDASSLAFQVPGIG